MDNDNVSLCLDTIFITNNFLINFLFNFFSKINILKHYNIHYLDYEYKFIIYYITNYYYYFYC